MKLTVREYIEFLEDIAMPQSVCLRRGQYALNRLHEKSPEIARAICNTDCDPFFLDDRLPKFIERLRTYVDFGPLVETPQDQP